MPKCQCHGEPSYWQKDKRMTHGGYWYCAVKHQARLRRYRRENPERRWRYYITKERPKTLLAQRERIVTRLEELEGA